jgi:NADPH2:quinone reductase
VEGLEPGDHVLFHAAAGGVGLIACQWAKALGLKLIGTAGGPAKCTLALEHGAAHAIDYTKEDFVARVKEITGGKGVPVVYDSVGKDTWPASLDCLEPLGTFVTFGNASGPLPPINALDLSTKGSLYFTRPTLVHYIAKREDLLATAKDLFDIVISGKVKLKINQRQKLADAAQAHRDLEGRKTTGSTILLP